MGTVLGQCGKYIGKNVAETPFSSPNEYNLLIAFNSYAAFAVIRSRDRVVSSNSNDKKLLGKCTHIYTANVFFHTQI